MLQPQIMNYFTHCFDSFNKVYFKETIFTLKYTIQVAICYYFLLKMFVWFHIYILLFSTCKNIMQSHIYC